jgi:HlyD family secretion protein
LSPGRIAALGARVGAAVDGPVVSISAGRLVISDKMDPTEARLLKVGMTAQIDSEVLGASARGRVSAIDPVTTDTDTSTVGGQPAADAAGGATGAGAGAAQPPMGTPYVPITISPGRELPAPWDGQDVRVTVTFAKTDAPVLAVPVAAIVTRPDGRTVVIRVDPGGRTAQVVVRAGVSADGLVQVEPAGGGLAAGDDVDVGRNGAAR